MLIDTNVWGELTRPAPNDKVVRFLTEHENDLYLSTIVLAEIEYGIAKVSDPTRAEHLLSSRNDIVLRVRDRILQPDFVAAVTFGKLRAELVANGTIIADFDLLIAAQALAAGMPVVTRNVGHIGRTGVRIINPWEPAA